MISNRYVAACNGSNSSAKDRYWRRAGGIAALTVLTLAGTAAYAAGPNEAFSTDINLQVEPYAELTFQTPTLLYLEVPPSTSTVNAPSSVKFTVTGNAHATMTAAPSEYILIPSSPTDDGGWMGKALMGSEPLGYQLLLTFPSNSPFGCGCGPVRSATLPLDDDVGTDPLTVNLVATGGTRRGSIDLYASTAWTLHGGLPLAGLYVGEIILMLTADY